MTSAMSGKGVLIVVLQLSRPFSIKIASTVVIIMYETPATPNLSSRDTDVAQSCFLMPRTKIEELSLETMPIASAGAIILCWRVPRASTNKPSGLSEGGIGGSLCDVVTSAVLNPRRLACSPDALVALSDSFDTGVPLMASLLDKVVGALCANLGPRKKTR